MKHRHRVRQNFNGGQHVILNLPAKENEMRAFGEFGKNQSANHVSPVSYSVVITDKHKDGVTLELEHQGTEWC